MDVTMDGEFVTFSMNGVEVLAPHISQFDQEQFRQSLFSQKWYTSHVAMQTERVLLANGVKIAKA